MSAEQREATTKEDYVKKDLDEYRLKGLTKKVAQAWKSFYDCIYDKNEKNKAAPCRAKLMENIINKYTEVGE